MKVRLNKYSKKMLLRRVIFLAVIVAASSVLLLVSSAIRTVSQYHSLIPVVENVVSAKKSEKPGLPKQLIITSIGINVDVEHVGLTSDGAMYIGPNSKTVSWYMLGPRPGDKGNAVIAGHYGWEADGKPAIFNDIQELKKGDEISTIDQEGRLITFVVKEIRKYNSNSDASDIFKSNDNNRHLNLITCNGTWENDKQTYSNRLVVFTDMKR